MLREQDREYYARRSLEERSRADETSDLKLKALHLALAARYETLAAFRPNVHAIRPGTAEVDNSAAP